MRLLCGKSVMSWEVDIFRDPLDKFVSENKTLLIGSAALIGHECRTWAGGRFAQQP